ncbi:AraC family transcriptional regulator [Sphingobium yanoikuyae]|jgi:AraC-like DNA-binding protein|uniref:AraC family transcriptional regulator n=1 Tax=Sphingobium yanoikuyae TaxID=13690 RepID=A0AA42WYB7_SPHYA|nr:MULTISPECIES: AraC family transcriptional regulator [Sphingobium]MBV2150378.1 AraC family transcriptional regulator [Sphingobium sp. AS12]MDH2134060.1 AraC family transcriptional regulator [Sphingobium yanoikuyae]MDH2148646.1 AraC family transcriptional regulator [Sphingobium yanoikuyae]MDH2165533.1 AraC family transcriptional regulator [Sphingobium yanoikuyae]QWT14304.1 AraC family transcriptional regulator [Sphingobium xenophagum]|tara:strand:+ start:335 stop:1243 length:909 start_codon:yes stop_codon:yes gene_type:complete
MSDPAHDRLIEALARHWARWGREPPLDGLTLMVSDRPTGLLHSLYRASFSAVLQGAKVSLLGECVFRYDAGKCLVASMDLPVTAQVVEASPERPYMAFSLAVDPAMVADLLLDQPEDGVVAPIKTLTTMAVGRLDATLLDPLARLFDLIDSPRDLAVIGPLIRREIVWRLLQGEHGPMLRQIGLADSRMARVARAVAWIRDHYAEPIRIPDLAALAGMSVAGLHRHFKAATTMSPIQFQKQVRLQAARRMVLADTAEIAAIGFSIGYESPSQFSRDYRRLFGEPPGRDGVAIRSGVRAAVEL